MLLWIWYAREEGEKIPQLKSLTCPWEQLSVMSPCVHPLGSLLLDGLGNISDAQFRVSLFSNFDVFAPAVRLLPRP